MPVVKLRPIELEARDCPAITIRLDYSHDTSGFFNDSSRRAALQRAADVVGSRLQDSFTAIVPNPAASRTWTTFTFNAASNSYITTTNPTIAANEIVVYATAGAVGGSELAVASSGGYNTGPFFVGDAWPNIIKGRGQAGALLSSPTDFAPWGGCIAFDTGINWNFNAAAPGFNQYDFESVALHELLHVLGFGLENVNAFERWVSGGSFTGPTAVSIYGGAVPLTASGHWASGVSSGGQTAVMVPAIPNGVERIVTPVDWAALADIGWQVTVPPPPPPPPPPTGAPGPVRFHVGSGAGHAPLVAGLNANGGTVWNAVPFDASFTGGVRVASGDFNADGVLDVAVGTGPGMTAQVRVLSGVNGKELFQINPFGTFSGGVFVAAGDLNGDGRADLLISPDRGGGPRVRAFTGNGFGQISDFFGIDDVNFRGGARVAAGDIDGDGRDDLIVTAGFGGGPRVAVFDGELLGLTGGPKFFGDFFAFESTLRNGAYVAAGDLDGDGRAELLAGGGPGGGPRVSAFDGAELLQGRQVRVADFFADSTSARGGIRIARFDRNGNGLDDIIVGAGEGFGSRLAVYDGPAVLGALNPPAVWSSNYFGDNTGIFVG